MVSDSRVAVVTGGGSGIGASAAKLLAQQGAAVAVVGRTLAKLEDTVSAIEAAGGQALAIPADLADKQAPAQIIEAVVKEYGRLDVLINCAAFINNLPFEQAERELYEKHLAVNVLAPYYLIQQALPYLRKSDSAVVINISSSSGSLVIPGQSMYGSSKAILDYLTRSLAAELAPDVRVNSIAPGPVDTPIHQQWAGKDVAAAYERMTKEVPLGRMGTADELGRTITWLASPEAGWITGVVLAVDGGQVLPGALSVISGK